MKNKEKTRSALLAEIKALHEQVANQQSVIEANNYTKEKWEESEKRLQTLLDATTDAAFLVSADEIIVACNDALAKSLGRSREELIGKWMFEFLSAEAAENRKLKFQEILESKKPLRWKDNHGGKSFDNSTYPILDLNGNVKFVAVYAKDITEQKKSEKELRVEKDKLKHILEAMEDGVYMVDQNYDIQYANQALVKDFGKYEGEKCYEYFNRSKKVCPWCKNSDVFVGKTVRWEWYSSITQKLYDLIATPLENADGTISKLEIFRDITNREKVKKDLQISEARYRTLFEESPISLWEEDLSQVKAIIDSLRDSGVSDLQEYFDEYPEKVVEYAGLIQVTDVNKASLDLYGADTIEELLSGITSLITAETYDVLKAIFVALAAGKVKYTYESVTQTLQGEKKQVVLSWSVAKGYENSWSKIILSIQDITLRKQAEEELQKSKKQFESMYAMFRLMADNMPDMLWAKDMDQNYLFTNKALCDNLLLAENTDEPIGRDDMFFVKRARKVQPDIPEWHTFGEICANTDIVVMESGKPQRFDEFGNIKGKFLFLDAYKAPIWDAQGKMLGTVGCGRDVTREKQIEQELQESKQRYNLAASAGLVGVWDLNLLTKDIYIDSQLKNLLGYADNEINDHLDDWTKLVHVDDLDQVSTKVRQYLQGKTPHYEVTHRMTHKDGSIRWILSRGTAIYNEQNKPDRMVGTYTDITASKQLQEKLKTRSRELNLLLKEVNHRVKNNLAAITGMLYVEQRLARESSKQRSQIDLLNDLVNRIKGLSMVHQMLSSSNWSPLSLKDLTRQVINSALQALPPGREIEVEISSDEPVEVTAKDAHHLAIILNELATNVVKYGTSAKNCIHVQISKKQQDGQKILFDFKDDGPGFPETIFKMEGRHVGLYLVENTVCHSLRGEVTFYNDNGAGISILFSRDIS